VSRAGEPERIRQSAGYYDQMFDKGGYGGVYDLPYWHSGYLPLFRGVLGELRRLGSRSVLEVGCGTGAFAHLLMDRTTVPYMGFDFSAVAVEKARERTGNAGVFFVGDACNRASYLHPYDTIVCTEVLEHVEDDLGAVANWQTGAKCVCSVPNFDAESHVRFFRDEKEVLARYGDQIAIRQIARIRKPALPDISWRSYARALRWYRYRPGQLLAVLGVGSFEQLGGWFLFSGEKR